MERREIRIESKKKKIEAFLQLVRSEEVKQETVTKVHNVSDNSDDARTDSEKLADNLPAGFSNKKTSAKLLAAEELAQLRMELKARQKAAMEKPKLFLSVLPLNGFTDRYDTCPDGLFVFDVQHLILYALQGGVASYKPRWCTLLRHEKLSHVVVVIVEAVGATDLVTFSDRLPYVTSAFPMGGVLAIFNHQFSSLAYQLKLTQLVLTFCTTLINPSVMVQLKAPSFHGQTISSQLFFVPVSNRKRRMKQNQQEADSDYELPPAKRLCTKYHFSRLDLLLSYQQMVYERYPLPQASSVHSLPEKKWKHLFTKKSYKQVSDTSPLFAIDCEMCETAYGSELTRVAVVNEQRQCVYTTLVKPHNAITNYLTRFSGITRNMLKRVKTRLTDVQQKIRELLPPDAILVGHSLNFDLDALQLMHPYIIDTSVIFKNSLSNQKLGLKRLASEVLHKVIQNQGNAGHDPCEDALAALDLVLFRLREESSDGGCTMALGSDRSCTNVESPSLDVKDSSIVLTKHDQEEVIKSIASSLNTVNDLVTSNETNIVDSSIGNLGVAPKEIRQHVKEEICDTTVEYIKKSVDSRDTLVTDSVQRMCFESTNTMGFKVTTGQDRNAFFCQTKLRAHDSLFNLLKFNNKTAAVSGFESDELPEPLNESVTVIKADSDKKVIRRCRQQSAVCQHYLTFVRLSDIERRRASTPIAEDTCDDQNLQIMMSKLDKRIEKLSSSLEPLSLLIVLLGGVTSMNHENTSQNAVCFMKIT